eukprot:maker-scaffold1604_size34042-snap-gene-0.14 protein:Tk08085 transcript:maker-scaffold1604_size34042-snap-gene-0.14-mRNA-1 annotation:"hypothetical protein DAPPUDRAFT_214129"
MDTPFYCDFIAGWVGGCAGIVVGHPLDTVKVRQQNATRDHGSMTKIMRECIKHEGSRGFFKGLSFPVLSAGALNSIFFGVYGFTINQIHPKERSDSPSMSSVFAAGIVGGFLQLSVACPVDLIKIKLQTQIGQSGGAHFKGPFDVIQKVCAQQGVSGLYKGLGIMALRDCPSFGIYMIIYDHTVPVLSNHNVPLVSFISGGIAGVISWLSIMPLDVVKSMLQADNPQNPRYHSILQAYRACVKQFGWRGFFRGSLAVSLRAFPVNGATFL